MVKSLSKEVETVHGANAGPTCSKTDFADFEEEAKESRCGCPSKGAAENGLADQPGDLYMLPSDGPDPVAIGGEFREEVRAWLRRTIPGLSPRAAWRR